MAKTNLDKQHSSHIQLFLSYASKKPREDPHIKSKQIIRLFQNIVSAANFSIKIDKLNWRQRIKPCNWFRSKLITLQVTGQDGISSTVSMPISERSIKKEIQIHFKEINNELIPSLQKLIEYQYNSQFASFKRNLRDHNPKVQIPSDDILKQHFWAKISIVNLKATAEKNQLNTQGWKFPETSFLVNGNNVQIPLIRGQNPIGEGSYKKAKDTQNQDVVYSPLSEKKEVTRRKRIEARLFNKALTIYRLHQLPAEQKQNLMIPDIVWGERQIRGNQAPEIPHTLGFTSPKMPGTLSKFFDSNNNPEVLFSFLRAAVEGLRVLHAQNIWHGDVKPDNIMVNPDTGSVMLADLDDAMPIESEASFVTTHKYSYQTTDHPNELRWDNKELKENLNKKGGKFLVDMRATARTILRIMNWGYSSVNNDASFIFKLDETGSDQVKELKRFLFECATKPFDELRDDLGRYNVEVLAHLMDAAKNGIQ